MDYGLGCIDIALVSERNNRKTRKLLGVEKGYALHHVLPCLRHYSKEIYAEWNLQMLY